MASEKPDSPQREPESAQDLRLWVLASQLGFEFVGPIVLAILLSQWLDWPAWAVAVGAGVGMVAGFTHLLLIVKRTNSMPLPKRKR